MHLRQGVVVFARLWRFGVGLKGRNDSMEEAFVVAPDFDVVACLLCCPLASVNSFCAIMF